MKRVSDGVKTWSLSGHALTLRYDRLDIHQLYVTNPIDIIPIDDTFYNDNNIFYEILCSIRKSMSIKLS